MKNINATYKAIDLIKENSKAWLCHKLGISRPTLDIRLKKATWKKGEKKILTSL